MPLIWLLTFAHLPSSLTLSRSEWQVVCHRSAQSQFPYLATPPTGYPDGHGDKTFTQEEEMKHLKEKITAGADFIVTQIFYDVDNFLDWTKRVRDHGAHAYLRFKRCMSTHLTGIVVPILAGIMPIQTYASFQRVTKLCGTHVPASLMQELDIIKESTFVRCVYVKTILCSIQGNDQEVKDFGVQLAVQMISRIAAAGAVRGFHFCTLNLEKSVQRVLETVGWAPGSSRVQNKLIAVRARPYPLIVLL
jgi:methylenetetrahydrofolate reductase (NADPH)